MANPRLAPQYNQRNAITYQAHRRQVIWQIYVPIAIVVILVVSLAVLAILAPEIQGKRWADIALIMLTSTVMISAFVSIFIIIFSIIGIKRGSRNLPYYLFMGQSYAFRLQSRLHNLSDRLVEPIFWTKSNFAKFQAIRPKRNR